METKTMNIGELADAVGITRRAVRFYVQQKLLPPPLGVGRGDHYDGTHLTALHRVIELQRAGHSLAAIARILACYESPQPIAPPAPPTFPPFSPPPVKPTPAPVPAPEPLPEPVIQTSLHTRLQIAPGVELQFDATKFAPTAEQLQSIRRFLRTTFESR